MAKKKLNRGEKRERHAGALALFVCQYGRKAQKGLDPNDRRYSEKTEKELRQLKPEKIDVLLRDDDE